MEQLPIYTNRPRQAQQIYPIQQSKIQLRVTKLDEQSSLIQQKVSCLNFDILEYKALE